MSELRAEQAVFGYARGHRMLASSVPIDAESGRTLRSVTDMSFDGTARAFLTVVPLPEMRSQAFVRSWPAAAWMRPGAVWSHVLLVHWDDLDRVSAPSDLMRAIAPRELRDERAVERFLLECESPRLLPLSHRKADVLKPVTPAVDVAPLLNSVYSSSRAVVFSSKDADCDEQLLMSMYAQQWGRLRQSFAFRTRYRSSDGPVPFDLELIERGPTSPEPAKTRGWAESLARDLRGEQPTLRAFLHEYGSDSRRGRRDMSILVRIEEFLRQPETVRDAVELLLAEFPDPRQMPRLKRDIFTEHGRIPMSEAQRLSLSIEFSNSLDLGGLEVGRRIAQLALAGEMSFKSNASIVGADFSVIPDDQIEGLLGEVASHLDILTVVAFARMHQDLGLLVAARRPEFLRSAALWMVLDGDEAGELFASLPVDERRAILTALLAEGDVDALAAASCSMPDAWWMLAETATSALDHGASLYEMTSLLRATLERIGMASLVGRPTKNSDPRYALVILLSAPLQAGLWRRLQPRTLISALPSGPVNVLGVSGPALDRLLAAALVSAASSGDAQLRKRGWEAVFPRLHEALKDPNFDEEAWGLLSSTLPSGPAWDRCYRLRRGAVAEIRRDRWGATSTSQLIRSAGSASGDIVEQLNRRKHVRKTWLDDVLRLIGFGS